MRTILIFNMITSIIFISIAIIYHFIKVIMKFYNYIKDLIIGIKENFEYKTCLESYLNELMTVIFVAGSFIFLITFIIICLFAMISKEGASL